ncbi:MAG: efflux RND transporter periplasmic adaptor subunit [Candidatus Krumholzibacteria bacterium]|nr:efflux RND transporter periplasmic adaptor subunit [Candidatus Krumholzibacteria bacterium]
MSLKKYGIATLGLALVLLGGCGGNGEQAGGGFQRPPTPVEAAPVVLGPVIDGFTTVGTLEAFNSITVTGEIDGIIVEVPFREGRRLAEGELIARLDDDQLKAEAQRARALRDKTKATWERVKSIVDQGAGAAQDLDDATADLKVAEANLALAETRHDKTRITAPFAGLAGRRLVSPGTFMRAGTPITQLAQIDRLRVAFAVPERILGSIHLGAKVDVSTPAFPEIKLTGVVDVIEPQLDTSTRTVGILALVDNPEEILRPGMSATIAVVLKERAEALTVPTDAVFVEGGQAYVYVIKPDSVVTRSAVSLGTRLSDVVEVLEGLDEGQQVVKAGHQKLYEGAKVMPVGGEPNSAEGSR